MKTNLQALRKAAGFKSARSFAEYMSMNVNTYTDYEQGKRMFTLDRACEFADALHCTLDELAGRESSTPAKNHEETRLLRAFKACDIREKESVLSMVELFAQVENEKRNPRISTIMAS